jgi:molecular chaperone HtpG
VFARTRRRNEKRELIATPMTEQTLPFQAEVSRLLHLVTHSLYSEKAIFLRELLSNASDACDRLRYAALTDPGLLGGDGELGVSIAPDAASCTLAISDNGIGMNRADLVEQLGTIAKSGTEAFVASLSGDAAKDVKLIGQFGVGFYAAFMVADSVEVISRKAGDAQAWRWRSDGTGAFTVGESERAGRGTTVILHLRQDAKEFVDSDRLRDVVKTYSDHIALPIRLATSGKNETINRASALWARPKAEITAEQYREFYHHVAHSFDDPWLTLHAHAEGKLDYTMLLFVPGRPPFDLFDPARKPRLKLYVRRVYIADAGAELVAPWLRFLRGVVDSADLPLNVSREMLQRDPVVARLRQAIQRRVLAELEKKAQDAAEYAAFWDNFGGVLKEGIYEDAEARPRLLKLARFHSTAGDNLLSLDDYIGRMKPGQSAIYAITGQNRAALAQSPHLEGFRAKGVEVLLLTDAVDDFWIGAVGEYGGKPFRSVTQGMADIDSISGAAIQGGDAEAKPAESTGGPEIAALIALLKQTLGDQVKDVRESGRLTGSAVCLVAAEGDLDLHLERILRQHQHVKQASPRILEINPRHPLIVKLAARAAQPGAHAALADAAHLLLDQARIIEGESLPDPGAFARRLAAALERSA